VLQKLNKRIIVENKSLDQYSDEELIAAFQHDSSEAFDEIVDRYKDPLTNFVYRFLSDYDECDDIVQETFVRVFRNKHAYKPQAKFSTWIYTIAGNLAKSRLRQRDRHRIFSLSTLWKSGDEEKEAEIPDNRYPADRDAERSLMNERIQRALNRISAKYREVVILRDVQEFSYEEIAQITGLNLGTVKSRIKRGRTMLQKLLKDIVKE
jgi:RNA polymerase sigma-70 factor (ECF subfamily)